MTRSAVAATAFVLVSLTCTTSRAAVPLISNFVVSANGWSTEHVGKGYDLLVGLPRGSSCLVHMEHPKETHTPPLPAGEHSAYSLVANSEQVAKSMSASVSASYGGGSFSAAGSLSISNSYNFSSDDTWIFVTKLVPTKTYWALQDPTQGHALDIDPHILDAMSRIHGTRKKLQYFRATCGDGYVDRLALGGYLAGHISVHNSSQVDRSSLESSLSGSGWGYSASASYSTSAMNSITSHSVSVAIDATGSNGSPTPTDVSQFTQYFASFGTTPAFVQDTLFATVRSYMDLPSWPHDSGLDLRSVPSSIDEMTLLAARLSDLNAQYSKIAENRASYHNLFYSDWASFDQAHDQIDDNIQLLRSLLQKCTAYSDQC